MPDISNVHFDVALTNLSIAYRNPNYAAAMIAPEVAVRRQSDRYFIYDPDREAARVSFDNRAPGTEAREVNFQLSNDSYFCHDHALESVLPDEEQANADAPLQPEADRVEFLTDKILLNMEVALANLVRTTGALPALDLTAEDTKWDDDATDPIAMIDDARSTIVGATQVQPNTLLLAPGVFRALRRHPKLVDLLKYTAGSAVSPQMLADLLEVDRVIVARTQYNTAAAGKPPAMAPVWGKDAMLLHVPTRPSLKSVAPFLAFAWSQAVGGSRGTSVQKWREERRKATMIRVQKYYDLKVVAPGACYVFRNAVA